MHSALDLRTLRPGFKEPEIQLLAAASLQKRMLASLISSKYQTFSVKILNQDGRHDLDTSLR